jgi:hypothetical protein
MKKRFVFGTVMTVLLAMTAGCDSNREEDTADIRFFLVDMPGIYEEVNIDIQAVQVIVNDSLRELATNQGLYNLLEFVNGRDTLLVDDRVPAGFISQVRLVLGDENTVKVDGVVHDLNTPSAQQSGLKLNVHQEFFAGESYAYVIDFDAQRSIVETGNGKYNLKPVIRVFTEAVTGSIQGVVDPPESKPVIFALRDKDTVSTKADTLSGEFMVRGLPAGTYELELDPVEGYSDTVLNDIPVFAGKITEIDTIKFE